VELRLIEATANKTKNNIELDFLIRESEELKKILGAIVSKSKK
jgi:hypothetical protein